jgi:hypothetical protein
MPRVDSEIKARGPHAEADDLGDSRVSRSSSLSAINLIAA